MDLIKTETAARQQRRARGRLQVAGGGGGEGLGLGARHTRRTSRRGPGLRLVGIEVFFSLFGDIEGIAAFVFG